MNKLDQIRRSAPMEFLTPLEISRYCYISLEMVERDDLGSTAKIIYALFSNITKNRVCEISIADLAKKIGCSKSTTRNALKELKKHRIVECDEDLSLSCSSSNNTYVLVIHNTDNNKPKEKCKDELIRELEHAAGDE
jgi:DNA-binding transcriptional regulator YhcF (GntR family)